MGAVAALLVLGFAGTAQADSGPGRDGRQVIQIQDRCDPATFDAAIGPGTCVRDGGTTFDEFLAEFLENGSVGHWRFHPDDTEIRAGQSITAKNVGGEVHTFTRVDRFGAGCVPLLNQPGQDPPAFCDDPAVFPGTGVPPGDKRTVEGLKKGTYKFQCLIHPWMRTVVTVR
jgi:plastocyanin